MTPTRMRRFQLGRAEPAALSWLREVLDREGQRFGTGVERLPDGTLELRWSRAAGEISTGSGVA